MKYPIDAITKQKVYRVSQDYRYPRRAYPGARVGKVRTDRQEAELNLIYVWKGTGKSSRFSDGKWPVLYTARQKVTSYVEVGYNLQRMFLPAKKPGIELKIPHICYSLTIIRSGKGLYALQKGFPKTVRFNHWRLQKVPGACSRGASEWSFLFKGAISSTRWQRLLSSSYPNFCLSSKKYIYNKDRAS